MFCRMLFVILGLLACSPRLAEAQDIDANPTARSRTPSTIADQITDPAEHDAFLALFKPAAPEQMLQRAKYFLETFPQSSFLAQSYEVAARASFDLQDYPSGLSYAKNSLLLLPENSLLLVAVADIEAREQHNDAAMLHARDALDDLERFGAPATVTPRDWPELKRKLAASANFALGRASLAKALELPPSEERTLLVRESELSLSRAQDLDPADSESTYLLGLARLVSGELNLAAASFARVYQRGAAFAPESLRNLQSIYKTLGTNNRVSFEELLKQSEAIETTLRTSAAPQAEKAKVQPMAEYAGSEACRGCHGEIYRAWSQSGMAKMLRPYIPQNVIGDFQSHNEFYSDEVHLNDETNRDAAKQQGTENRDRALFARMITRNGRHYFDIRQLDGTWHSYPVDYTIGSKFQQAYATTLPNGQIHVFPIQYNALRKQWINYWKIIDLPGSERADLHSWERLDASTSYQAICAVCHTSQLRNVKGGGFETDNLQFKEPGINCEMCHGPSLQHVVDMSTGNHEPKPPLEPPVNFQDISNRDFVSICAQCHMQSAIRTPGPAGELNYLPTNGFFSESPRIPFGDFSRKGFYKDGRFRQTTFIVEALERSQCFKKGQVSCGTCHNPHGHDQQGGNVISNPTSLKFRDQPDLMCVGCHSDLKSDVAVAAHTHHRVNSEGSRCVACHMPRIMDALLFEARTHQIDDIPKAEMTLRFGQRESPNACLLCHAEKTPRWLSQQLSTWKLAAR
jgi:Doubled CXXCH motif (Paired_CXXCH_1)/Cytochrome c554 and c-prime